jgi:hypothetical protein
LPLRQLLLRLRLRQRRISLQRRQHVDADRLGDDRVDIVAHDHTPPKNDACPRRCSRRSAY